MDPPVYAKPAGYQPPVSASQQRYPPQPQTQQHQQPIPRNGESVVDAYRRQSLNGHGQPAATVTAGYGTPYAAAVPTPYGAQPQPYGAQPTPYGNQPQSQQPYGAQQQPYGSPSQPYGSQAQSQQYGSQQYGQPQPAYGQPQPTYAQVQPYSQSQQYGKPPTPPPNTYANPVSVQPSYGYQSTNSSPAATASLATGGSYPTATASVSPAPSYPIATAVAAGAAGVGMAAAAASMNGSAGSVSSSASTATAGGGTGVVGGAGGSSTARFRSTVETELSNKIKKELKDYLHKLKSEVDEELSSKWALDNSSSEMAAALATYEDARGRLEMANRDVEDKMAALETWRVGMESKREQDAENYIVPYDDLSGQILRLQAEILAVDDAIYYLEKGLANSVIDLATFLKETRNLASKQFLAKNHQMKINAAIALSVSSGSAR